MPRLTPPAAPPSASTTSPPTRCSARSAPTIRRSPKPRRTIRAAPIRPARPRRTIWCAPGTTPTGCRPSSATPCNNYGPWQFPEKLIPLVTLNALEGKDAAGLRRRLQRRDWLFVEDHAEALVRVAGAAASPAPPTRSAPASRAATCRWCRRSAPCWTVACPIRPGPREPPDPLRHRPSRPRFPLRDRSVAHRGRPGLARAA